MSWLRRAYPRSRGGTQRNNSNSVGPTGLSPLARGNRPLATGSGQDAGPIPARAGQPFSCCVTHSRLGPIPARAGQPYGGGHRGLFAGAYPRSRGATSC